MSREMGSRFLTVILTVRRAAFILGVMEAMVPDTTVPVLCVRQWGKWKWVEIVKGFTILAFNRHALVLTLHQKPGGESVYLSNMAQKCLELTVRASWSRLC